MKKAVYGLLIFTCLILAGRASGWLDYTHIAIGTAAQFEESYSLAAPDIAKLKAYSREGFNHYCDLLETETVTPELIKEQIPMYNNGSAGEKRGHLYGAIVAAVRNYQKAQAQNKFGLYHLSYAGHYIGDLSMPLHNMEYNPFNKAHHLLNDGLLENELKTNTSKIKIVPIAIQNEDDLIRNIALIANKSKELAYRLQKENRDMTEEEAYEQVSQSASLFKAVLKYAGYNKTKKIKNYRDD